VYTTDTSCMKGTSVHIKNYNYVNKKFCNHKVRDFFYGFPGTNIFQDLQETGLRTLMKLLYLTNKEGHLRTRGKCTKYKPQASGFYISQVFSNDRSVLLQCTTRLRLLPLL